MSDPKTSSVRVERPHDGVALITISSPPMNLVTVALTRRLLTVLDGLSADDTVRAVVLTGDGGKAFSVGSDVKEFPSVREEVVPRKLAEENELMHRLEEFPAPVIAALNGLTLGGGCELALACDVRILSEDGRIGQPEVHLGVIPGSGGLFRLPRLVGAGRAAEIVLWGRILTAEEALAIGLVNKVVPGDQVVEEALRWARAVASGPQAAIRGIKRLLRETAGLSSREAARLTFEVSDRVFRSEDLNEGMQAFLEKRKPRFN